MNSDSELLTTIDGGVQTIIPSNIALPQLVYLDFDGAVASYYNRDLGIAINDATIAPSGFGDDDIAAIVASLNAQFDDVVFTSSVPSDGEFSTVYIGVTSAFDEYGSFYGLAETIDSGNQIHDDNAFVILDSSATAELVVSVIAHETEHIVHGMDHGGEGLARYATITISDGQVSSGLTIENSYLYVSSGGTAVSTTVNCGCVYVSNGGMTVSTTFNSGGALYVMNGGTADHTIMDHTRMDAIGEVYVSSGGIANYTTVRGGVDMEEEPIPVFALMDINGGVANYTTLGDYSDMYVSNGGTANSTTVSGGVIHVSGSGTMNLTTVSRGSITVFAGGRVDSTTLDIEGYLAVIAGVANSTTINRVGDFHIYSGGTAINTIVNSGGYLFLLGGGIHSGTLMINPDALIVSAYSGAIIDFTVAEQEDASVALINRYDLISGAADAIYIITVNDNQAYGTYALADHAESFNKSITVKTVAGNSLGSLSMGNILANGTSLYSLSRNDSGTLLLDIIEDNTPPTITNVAADITSLTKGNVTVSAVFTDNYGLAQSLYRIGDGEWLDYTGAVTVTENATVYFKAIDYADNVATAQYEVTNIINYFYTYNTTANGDGGFNEAFAEGGEIRFDSSSMAYNYTGGMTATHSVDIIGNGTSGTMLVGGNLYMDGNDASFSNLTLYGQVFGGFAASSGLKGCSDVYMSFSNVNFADEKRVYGGAVVSGNVLAGVGNISLCMDDVDGGDSRIFGAGKVSENAMLVTGDIDLEVSCAPGGSFVNLFAGADVDEEFTGGIFCETVNTVIDGGGFTYCGNGSQLRGGASVQKDSTLTINGGTFSHYVYAGGFSAGGTATVDGDSTLIINGGTFNAHVFGGCGASNSENGGYTLVKGAAGVWVNAFEETVTFDGCIFAGSMGYGNVSGGTSLTFTGYGDKLRFATDSYVTGNSQMFRGTVQYVGGDQTLAFEDFTGDFAANFNNTFTRLAVSGSQVAFTGGLVALGSISKWEVEVGSADAALALGDAKNSFKGDSLTLTLADGATLDSSGLDVIAGTDVSLKGWAQFSSVTLCGEDAAFADGEWSSENYRLFREDDTLKLALLA